MNIELFLKIIEMILIIEDICKTSCCYVSIFTWTLSSEFISFHNSSTFKTFFSCMTNILIWLKKGWNFGSSDNFKLIIYFDFFPKKNYLQRKTFLLVMAFVFWQLWPIMKKMYFIFDQLGWIELKLLISLWAYPLFLHLFVL